MMSDNLKWWVLGRFQQAIDKTVGFVVRKGRAIVILECAAGPKAARGRHLISSGTKRLNAGAGLAHHDVQLGKRLILHWSGQEEYAVSTGTSL